jgi:hypothetical protein
VASEAAILMENSYKSFTCGDMFRNDETACERSTTDNFELSLNGLPWIQLSWFNYFAGKVKCV